MIVKSPGVLYLLLVREGVGHVVVPALRPEDVRGEVGDADLLVTGPVGAAHQAVAATLLVLRDGADVAPEIVVAPRDKTVVRGTTLSELHCVANARPLHALEILW